MAARITSARSHRTRLKVASSNLRLSSIFSPDQLGGHAFYFRDSLFSLSQLPYNTIGASKHSVNSRDELAYPPSWQHIITLKIKYRRFLILRISSIAIARSGDGAASNGAKTNFPKQQLTEYSPKIITIKQTKASTAGIIKDARGLATKRQRRQQ